MKTSLLPSLLAALALFAGRSLSILITDPSQLPTTAYDYIIVGGAYNKYLLSLNALTFTNSRQRGRLD